MKKFACKDFFAYIVTPLSLLSQVCYGAKQNVDFATMTCYNQVTEGGLDILGDTNAIININAISKFNI